MDGCIQICDNLGFAYGGLQLEYSSCGKCYGPPGECGRPLANTLREETQWLRDIFDNVASTQDLNVFTCCFYSQQGCIRYCDSLDYDFAVVRLLIPMVHPGHLPHLHIGLCFPSAHEVLTFDYCNVWYARLPEEGSSILNTAEVQIDGITENYLLSQSQLYATHMLLSRSRTIICSASIIDCAYYCSY